MSCHIMSTYDQSTPSIKLSNSPKPNSKSPSRGEPVDESEVDITSSMKILALRPHRVNWVNLAPCADALDLASLSQLLEESQEYLVG